MIKYEADLTSKIDQMFYAELFNDMASGGLPHGQFKRGVILFNHLFNIVDDEATVRFKYDNKMIVLNGQFIESKVLKEIAECLLEQISSGGTRAARVAWIFGKDLELSIQLREKSESVSSEQLEDLRLTVDRYMEIMGVDVMSFYKNDGGHTVMHREYGWSALRNR